MGQKWSLQDYCIAMKGHHPTPPDLAKRMASLLFEDKPPREGDRILYPGCGKAPFAVAVEDICREEGWPLPEGTGIESDRKLIDKARIRQDLSHLRIEEADFLGPQVSEKGPFEYILGNPPYVSIEGLSEEEKSRYREKFRTANGRFDLYLLFFERALNLLGEGGRLVFVTPEKWEYVDTAGPLRQILSDEDFHVERLYHIEEDAFGDLVTYPLITTVSRTARSSTRVDLRDGTVHHISLPKGKQSWASAVRDVDPGLIDTNLTLGDICTRISPGVATGRDKVFVKARGEVPSKLKSEWVYPTVSGSQLGENGTVRSDSVFVCPYQEDGVLPPEEELGNFLKWVSKHRETLENRSCVRDGKKWYAWHENPPMTDILQPKILFPDFAKEPEFWPETQGDIVPRHSVYYIIPKEGVKMESLLEYLNGPIVKKWIEGNCQRADNGYYRLQSRVLENLPVPERLKDSRQKKITF